MQPPANPERPGDAELIAVGRIVNTHGLRGEMRVQMFNPDSTAVQPETEVVLRHKGADAPRRVRSVRPHNRVLLVILEGCDSIDQAETLVMRLNRGAGVRGLAGMRPSSVILGGDLPLVRPLLPWQRAELEEICAAAGLEPATDPSNSDDRFERVRVRQALATAPWLDPSALARSATHLAAADDALGWATDGLALTRISDDRDGLRIDAAGLPPELQRRLLLVAFARFHAAEPRGPDLSRALDALASGGTTTLSGLLLKGGEPWRIAPAPPRKTAISSDDL